MRALILAPACLQQYTDISVSWLKWFNPLNAGKIDYVAVCFLKPLNSACFFIRND